MDRYGRETAHRTFSRQDVSPTTDLPSESIGYDADTVELDAPPAAAPVDEPAHVSVTVNVHGSGKAPPAVQVSTERKPQIKPETEPESERKPESKPRSTPGPELESKSDTKPVPKPAPTPQAPPPAEVAAFREGETIRARYVLEEQIGSGGTSRVFRARDLRRDPMFDRDGYVALKVPRESLRDRADIAERLRREFHQTQALAHPNIVRALDIDCEDGTWFITLELLDGESLSTLLACLQPQVLPQDEALSILRGCGEALAFAHDRGVLHCDFKPGNVFVTRGEDVRVLDFGVAGPGAPGGQGSGVRVAAATPCYASPDILEGQPPDERDDVFSFACVAYEVLAGRHPFERRSTLEAREQGMLVQRVPSLTRRQHRVLQRALSWSRRTRPGSIRELMIALGLTEQHHSSSLGWLKAGAAVAAGAVIAAVAFNLYQSREQAREDRPAVREARGVTEQPRAIQWAAASPAERREREAQLAARERVAAGGGAAGVSPPGAGQTQAEATRSEAATPAPRATAPVSSSGAGPLQSYPLDASPAASTSRDTRNSRAAASAREAGSAGTAGSATGDAVAPAANRISFEQARIVASEGAVSAVLRVRRLDDLNGRVRIQWRAVPGTAQPGSDYSMDGIGTIDIPSGQDLRVVFIPILNDAQREPNESFDVELFDVSGPGSLEPITRATVTILDND